MILLWLVFALLVCFFNYYFLKMVIHKNVYLYHDSYDISYKNHYIFYHHHHLYHTNLTFKSSRQKYPDILFFLNVQCVCVLNKKKEELRPFIFTAYYIYYIFYDFLLHTMGKTGSKSGIFYTQLDFWF